MHIQIKRVFIGINIINKAMIKLNKNTNSFFLEDEFTKVKNHYLWLTKNYGHMGCQVFQGGLQN